MANNEIISNIYEANLQVEDGCGYTSFKILYHIAKSKENKYFAIEVMSKLIFPIYGYVNRDGKNITITQKYIKKSKNSSYIYLPCNNKKDLFEIKYSELKKINDVEYKRYIEEKNSNFEWTMFMQKYSSYNSYKDININDLTVVENVTENLEKKNDFLYETPTFIEKIDKFGYDLAKKNNLGDLVGRHEELKKLNISLGIIDKSVLIIGESGSGKTSLVEALAKSIKNGDNKWLKNKIIFCLNTNSLAKGTKYRGEFEEKIQKLIDECVKHRNEIILFIDEIHTLYGLGSTLDNNNDAMNILKPYLSCGEITIVGATTKEEYEKYMINDEAFLERFDLINLDKLSEEMVLEILNNYIKELENKYKINVNLDSDRLNKLLEYILKLTDKKNQNVVGVKKKSNPRLSKEIILYSFGEALYNESENVSLENFLSAIFDCNNINLSVRKNEIQKIKNNLQYIEDKPKRKVIEFKVGGLSE